MPTILRSKRADLVEQELYAVLITYNMIRSLMKEATNKEGGNPLFISFLDTMQTIIECAPHMSAEKCRLSDCLTHFIFNYFTYQSGFVFRSERAPIGKRNGTIRSSYFPSL
jgi:hypothetical protein